jgi:hypothetical protein
MDEPEKGKPRLPLYGSIDRFSASGGSSSRLSQSPYNDLQVALESPLSITFFKSMCGLLMKIKWCAWAAIFCSMTSYANSRTTEDARQGIN